MSKYSAIDSDLNKWAEKFGLAWAHEYKDEEVRSLDIDIGCPRKAQIWIELSSDEIIEIKAWDRKKRTFAERTSASQLCAALDKVLLKVNDWRNYVA